MINEKASLGYLDNTVIEQLKQAVTYNYLRLLVTYSTTSQLPNLRSFTSVNICAAA
jgi:hypothetical protein